MQTKLMNAIDTYAQALGRVVQAEESGDSDEKIASLHEAKRQARDAVQAMLVAAAPQAVQAAVPESVTAEPGQFNSGDTIVCVNTDGATFITKDKEYVAGVMGRNPGGVFVVSDDGKEAEYRADRFVISATHPTQQGLEAGSFEQSMSEWAHGDAKDAARYQWLREQHDKGDDSVTIFIGDEQHGPGHLDAQVDEAIAAQAKQGGV